MGSMHMCSNVANAPASMCYRALTACQVLQGISDVEEDFSWLWDDPDLEPSLFDDALAQSPV